MGTNGSSRLFFFRKHQHSTRINALLSKREGELRCKWSRAKYALALLVLSPAMHSMAGAPAGQVRGPLAISRISALPSPLMNRGVKTVPAQTARRTARYPEYLAIFVGGITAFRLPGIPNAYKDYIAGTVFLVLAEMMLIAGLLRNRVKKRTLISELEKSQAVLRESEERFRLVANTAPVMIWMSGPDKMCVYFNKPWLDFTGRTLEQELGNGWAEGVHADDLQRCLDIYSKSFDERKAFTMEYRLRRHDDQYRWIHDTGVPRFNQDGSFAGYIGSCIDVADRIAAQEALSSVNRRLIAAHEEERTWIARELHDDICQRVAFLGIELSQIKQDIPTHSADLRGRMQQAWQHTAEISNEIHSLSHRLHSSKLEYLGIVEAARAFCQEFAEQQKVEIDFLHDEIPRGLPREVSVCLFRVLQEALRNAVKYSGVRYFEVELRAAPDEVRLSVRDGGVGFDPRAAMAKSGIGLVSMQERLNLVKGRIEIESALGCGTTVRASVPFQAESQAPQAQNADLIVES